MDRLVQWHADRGRASPLRWLDLLVLFPGKRNVAAVRFDPLPERRVTVALTAYNDEQSIGDAVVIFAAHPLVDKVIVVSNNSTDATFERAREAGAITFNETAQGYGLLRLSLA